MAKRLFINLFIICSIFLFPNKGVTYDPENVHQNINEAASRQATNLESALQNLNFANGVDDLVNGTKIYEWFSQGGADEDESDCRAKFHFHDPTESFDEAGLSNLFADIYCFDLRHRSLVVWAQDEDNQYSWQRVREKYYWALTDTTDTQKDINFVETFRGLGRQMHLIADASVPAHTRNDVHVYRPILGITFGQPNIETWTSQNENALDYNASAIDYSIVDNSLVPGLVPITNFWDTMPSAGYNPNPIGIAEYSNYNFFSIDTIFKDYTYPQQLNNFYLEPVVAEDDITDYRVYFNGMTFDGIPIQYLASTGYLWSELSDQFPYDLDDGRFNLDDNCYEEYASILIPRAVGYSAGLLDYFFRGSINISIPGAGIYAQTDDPNQGFTSIKLLAENTTSTGEEMTDGSIELVVKYKIAQEDPFQSIPVPTTDEFSYTVVPEFNNIRFIPRNTSVELTFDLGPNTILPINATDVYLQVVYKGQLGNEDGAVAVGLKDISEPTPVDLFNNMDYICLYGNWYDAGESAAITVVDTDGTIGNNNGIADEWDVFTHNIEDAYLNISNINNPISASPSDYTFYKPLVTAGTLYRAYVLSDYDYTFNLSDYMTALKTVPEDTWTHAGGGIISGDKPASAIKNQTDYNVESQTECDTVGATAPCEIRYYPLFYLFRGINIWGSAGYIIENPKYPLDTNCSWDLLP